MITYFRTPPEHRGKSRVMWCAGALAICFCILALLGLAAIRGQASSIPGSDAAARWTAEDSPHTYAQISVCYGDDRAFNLETLYMRRAELEKSLTENAVAPENDRARLYLDCYSGETQATLSTSRTDISARITAAGGNFFFFHPAELICGSYFSEDGELPYTVVLDDNAAWQLFGALDVAGMEVTICGQPFRITGVVKAPRDALSVSAYGDEVRAYVNYVGMRLAAGIDRITDYEILLQNPIKNFARDSVMTAFSVQKDDPGVKISDSTTRFGFETLTDQIPDFFSRAMRTDSVIPPWWENLARVAEYKAVAWAAFTSVTGILSAVLLIVFLSLWFYIHPVKVKNIYGYFEEKAERKRMKNWLLKKKAEQERAALKAEK